MNLNKPYWWWSEALKGTAPTAIVDEPECGFYRLKRNGGWLPVAVYPLNGALAFKIGGQAVHANVGVERGRYCANPITEDEYRNVAERGMDWADADPTVAAMQARTVEKVSGTTITVSAPVTFQPGDIVLTPQPDPTAEFREQIETAKAGVAGYATIATDEASTRAASLRNMLLKLAADAEEARKAEKKPHWDAAQAADAKWQPLIKDAQAAAQTVRSAMEKWENEKRVAARVAADRAAAEQRERDSRRDISEPAPDPVKPQSNLPPPVAQVKPAYGRASAVQTFEFVTAIDAAKVFAHFNAHPDVLALLTKLAQAALNAGIEIDGVTHETRTRIK